jgi:hypothetical protein
MNLDILPLAITMMAGPQIMSAIIFVTTPKPVKVSMAFIAAVAIAVTVGVLIPGPSPPCSATSSRWATPPTRDLLATSSSICLSACWSRLR